MGLSLRLASCLGPWRPDEQHRRRPTVLASPLALRRRIQPIPSSPDKTSLAHLRITVAVQSRRCVPGPSYGAGWCPGDVAREQASCYRRGSGGVCFVGRRADGREAVFRTTVSLSDSRVETTRSGGMRVLGRPSAPPSFGALGSLGQVRRLKWAWSLQALRRSRVVILDARALWRHHSLGHSSSWSGLCLEERLLDSFISVRVGASICAIRRKSRTGVRVDGDAWLPLRIQRGSPSDESDSRTAAGTRRPDQHRFSTLLREEAHPQSRHARDHGDIADGARSPFAGVWLLTFDGHGALQVTPSGWLGIRGDAQVPPDGDPIVAVENEGPKESLRCRPVIRRAERNVRERLVCFSSSHDQHRKSRAVAYWRLPYFSLVRRCRLRMRDADSSGREPPSEEVVAFAPTRVLLDPSPPATTTTDDDTLGFSLVSWSRTRTRRANGSFADARDSVVGLDEEDNRAEAVILPEQREASGPAGPSPCLSLGPTRRRSEPNAGIRCPESACCAQTQATTRVNGIGRVASCGEGPRSSGGG
uniref:Uncharacterized protein n=1 Tax=Mycena chlorophos TaxID=658473 RepID=A0ABQ0LJ40_MYCCL|nr:predicted protein [Mycena chlorophos]